MPQPRHGTRRLRRFALAIALTAAVAVVAAPSLALGEDVDEPADATAPGPTVLATNAAVVRYAPGRLVVGLDEDASRTQVDRLVRRTGATVGRSIGKIDARVLEVPNAEIDEAMASLDASPAVEYVEREVLLARTGTVPNDVLWTGQWGPRLVGTPRAWDFARGSARTVIAVLDTGVDYGHPDLQGAFVPGYDFVAKEPLAADDNGHGTAAAGVIAARTHNREGQAGICWSCSLMPVKVLDATGWGTSSAVAAGIVWATENGARVISLSLGGPGTTQALSDAVAYAASKGVVIVAAAGNSGTTTRFYPAAYPGVVGVAATTSSDKLYAWSNRGDWVQVTAPGCNTAPRAGGGYVNFCGTSSATPLVAGIAGLALSRAPGLGKGELERALRTSAVPLAFVRHGRVRAFRTLAALGLIPPENTKRPRIRGVPRTGRTLEATKGRWSARPTRFSYQWRRCNRAGRRCANIRGATARTYVVRRADVGSRLRVRIRAVNRTAAKRAVSNATERVRRGARRPRTATRTLAASGGFQAATQPSAVPTADAGAAGLAAPAGDADSPANACQECSPPAPTLTETITARVGAEVAEATLTTSDLLAGATAPPP